MLAKYYRKTKSLQFPRNHSYISQEGETCLTNDHSFLKLILVGGSKYQEYKELYHPNLGCIHFVGRLKPVKVKQHYRIANIGVIPSVFKQCSYVTLKMMQHSLPIVCSYTPTGLIELFENKKVH
ncbi:MAG: glycosyltransferase [Draconibacterium sp.]